MKQSVKTMLWIAKNVLGCAIFSLGFAFFLIPRSLNAGGLSGLAMVVVHLIKFGSVGTLTALINLPLFIVCGMKIGRKFFAGSLIGMLVSSLFIDLFAALLPPVEMEPLLAALYGGVLCGLGLGIVYNSESSTGGSDIIVRLLKRRWPNVPIGTLNTIFDGVVVLLTGLVFRDFTRALYSGVAVFITGQVVDAVVYRFDYSKVVMIISPHYKAIAEAIGDQLDRGATFLEGQGSYSRTNTKVVFTVVKKQQVADLKKLVVELDPNAFIVVQEAHQVLGEGFARYNKNSL